MTHQARPLTTQTQVEAFVASAWALLGWLLGAIVKFGLTGRSARLERFLNRAERVVEAILYLQAQRRVGPPPRRKRHPRFARPGFHRRRGNRRLFLRSVRIRAPKRAGALARVLALIAALARPERAIAHFIKRLGKGLTLFHLTVIAPPAHAFACQALDDAICAIDSS